MSVKIEGADVLMKKLDDIAKADKLEANMKTACAMVEADAKRKAPKDTGALRRSIESKVENKGNEVEGIIFTPLNYAPYVEFGTGLFAEKGGRTNVPWVYVDAKGQGHRTSGQHPQPFLRPALNENRDRIIKKLKEGIGQ